MRRPVALWVAILVGVIAFTIGALAGSSGKKDESAATSTTVSTTTTAPAPTETTTTTEPTTTTEAQPVQVLDVAGKNKTNSDNFAVTGRWTIHCETSGGAGTAVKILKSSGESVDYISFDATGDSAQRGSGTYFRSVRSARRSTSPSSTIRAETRRKRLPTEARSR